MAVKLSKFEIGMIAAFVVVTGAGVGGYFYTDGMVQTAKQEMSDAGSQLQKLLKQRYLPSRANITTLEANITQLEEALKPIREKVLAPSESKLEQIEAKNPVTWKNSDLDQTVQRLTALAKNKRVAIPPDYYFGFSRYQKSNPSEQATLILGKQLYGIDRLASMLFDSGAGGAISALNAVRRTFDEEGASSGFGGGSATSGDAGESIRGNVFTLPNGLYRIYPFEMEFTGTTLGLRAFLNSLLDAQTLFIVRSIQVTNSKMDSPKLADLGKSSAVDGRTSGGAGREVVFGNEQLRIRMRVDMIEWLGGKEMKEEASKQPGKPAPKPVK